MAVTAAVQHVLSEFLLDARDCPLFFATIDVQAPRQKLNVDLSAGLLPAPFNGHHRRPLLFLQLCEGLPHRPDRVWVLQLTDSIDHGLSVFLA